MEVRSLVVSSSRNMVRHVTRSLASTGYEVLSSPLDRNDVIKLLQPDGLCIIDADEDEEEIRWLLNELCTNHPNVIPLLLSHDHTHFMVELLAREQLNNIIARHGGVASTSDLIDENELIVTCQKLLHRDIFGLEKYLPTWGIKIYEMVVSSTNQKQEAVAKLEDFLERIDCWGAIKSSVLLVADELLMNAIFNAPRDEAGNSKYGLTDRRSALKLQPREAVRFRFACDGRNISLSVKDQFGSLDRQVIVKYLRRCFAKGPAEIEDKKAGAGLGLYMVYNSITQLTFNIHANVATEVIASFYARSGARAFKLSGRSLNIFLIQD